MTDQDWLEAALNEVGASSGTVHRVEGGLLVLKAAIGIPEPVLRVTATIPQGKGMAGLAWSRGVSVETCDLKHDETGDVMPGAKAVDALEAVAIPVFEGGAVRAVVGFAFAEARTPGLEALAATLP